MSQLKVNSIVDAAGGSSAVLYGVASPPNSMGFRNRIINGEMRIDQRGLAGGANVTTANYYGLDRWTVSRNGGAAVIGYGHGTGLATSSAAGFTDYLSTAVNTAASPAASDFSFIRQWVEGLNVADLAWGTSAASSITISFYVSASITGTYAASVRNSAGNRSYVSTFSIAVANSWQYVTLTIPGDTSGTWLKNNEQGLALTFDLGSGSNSNTTAGAWQAGAFSRTSGCVTPVATSGATFYITGVQLEAGTVASPFERRDYGRELMMCQRYYQTTYNGVVAGTVSTSGNLARYLDGTTAYASHSGQFPVAMRATPTMAVYNPNTGAVSSMAADASNPAAVATALGPTGYRLYVNNVSVGVSVGLSAHYTANSEL